MALHFPLMVNDRAIAHVYILRIAGGEEPDSENVYDWEVFPVNDPPDPVSGHETVLARGRVTHRYGDGALELCRIVLNHYHQRLSERFS